MSNVVLFYLVLLCSTYCLEDKTHPYQFSIRVMADIGMDDRSMVSTYVMSTVYTSLV